MQQVAENADERWVFPANCTSPQTNRLPPEHRKDVHAKAKKISAARAKARQQDKRIAKQGAKELLTA